MTIKWVKADRGLRYYEHPTRKHGKSKDRYYSVRFTVGQVEHNHGIGWVSDGVPKEAKDENPDISFIDYCRMLLRNYRWNAKTGEGATSPKEQRTLVVQAKEEAERARLEAEEQRRIEEETLSEYFETKYFPYCSGNKAPNTVRTEKILFTNWIEPVIGHIPFLNIAQTDLERVKKRMSDAGKASKTIHSTLALIRQIYNHAKRPDIYLRAKTTMPRVDNAKLRYLTPEEIHTLLNALKEKSPDAHDQTLLAIHTGLRFSEVACLQWGDVNYDTGTLAIRDSKTGSRTVFFNDDVRQMLEARQSGAKHKLVFPVTTGDKKGTRHKTPSNTFKKIADALFNEGVTDRRLRVTFHTLRHTFGTYVYQNSGDLYLAQRALGHRTLVMAQRYAKMSEPKLREAFNGMTNTLKQGQVKKDNVVEFSPRG